MGPARITSASRGPAPEPQGAATVMGVNSGGFGRSRATGPGKESWPASRNATGLAMRIAAVTVWPATIRGACGQRLPLGPSGQLEGPSGKRLAGKKTKAAAAPGATSFASAIAGGRRHWYVLWSTAQPILARCELVSDDGSGDCSGLRPVANRGGGGDPAYPRPLATQGDTVCHALLLRIMVVIRNPKIQGARSLHLNEEKNRRRHAICFMCGRFSHRRLSPAPRLARPTSASRRSPAGLPPLVFASFWLNIDRPGYGLCIPKSQETSSVA